MAVNFWSWRPLEAGEPPGPQVPPIPQVGLDSEFEDFTYTSYQTSFKKSTTSDDVFLSSDSNEGSNFFVV